TFKPAPLFSSPHAKHPMTLNSRENRRVLRAELRRTPDSNVAIAMVQNCTLHQLGAKMSAPSKLRLGGFHQGRMMWWAPRKRQTADLLTCLSRSDADLLNLKRPGLNLPRVGNAGGELKRYGPIGATPPANLLTRDVAKRRQLAKT